MANADASCLVRGGLKVVPAPSTGISPLHVMAYNGTAILLLLATVLYVSSVRFKAPETRGRFRSRVVRRIWQSREVSGKIRAPGSTSLTHSSTTTK